MDKMELTQSKHFLQRCHKDINTLLNLYVIDIYGHSDDVTCYQHPYFFSHTYLLGKS